MTPHLTLSTLQHECHLNATSHGFWEPDCQNVGEKVALIHSELSEFLERYRKDQRWPNQRPTCDEHCLTFSNQEIELADVIIRIFDLAGWLKMDLAGAILAKMKYNESRPYKHGKAF